MPPLRTLLSIALATTSCATTSSRTIIAAPDATHLASTLSGAKESKKGVTVTVRFAAWDARPPTLTRYMLPVFVRVSNASSSTYRTRVKSFSLYYLGVGSVHPLPPEEISGTIEESVELAPSPFVTGWRWNRGWGLGGGWGYSGGCFSPYDPFCGYGPSYRVITSRLPTGDMIDLSFRFGSIPPGEERAGFLYFPTPPEGTATFQFETEVDSAERNDSLRFLIPFLIESN